MFNFLKRDNSPPIERCKLLKEKLLDVVKPEFIVGSWVWVQDTVKMYYLPGHRSVAVFFNKVMLEGLSRKELEWLVEQAEGVVDKIEERDAQNLLEKLRSL